MSAVAGVCVVVTTCNRAPYLRGCLASIFRQTHRPQRIVVADDASADATRDVVAEAAVDARHLGIDLVYVRHDTRQGQEANRRSALRAASCEWVTMLDDDDLYAPRYLEFTIPILEAHPEVAFVATGVTWMEVDGSPSLRATERAERRFGRSGLCEGVYQDVLARCLAHKSFFLLGVMFRRRWLHDIGYVPAPSGAVCDLAIFCELGLRGAAAYYLPERLAYYRIHPGQQTTERVAKSRDAKRWAYHLLARVSERGACTRHERRLMMDHTIDAHRELAIALAHQGAKAEAVREFGDLIRRWGFSAVSGRLLVLGALLAGVGRSSVVESDAISSNGYAPARVTAPDELAPPLGPKSP